MGKFLETKLTHGISTENYINRIIQRHQSINIYKYKDSIRKIKNLILERFFKFGKTILKTCNLCKSRNKMKNKEKLL